MGESEHAQSPRLHRARAHLQAQGLLAEPPEIALVLGSGFGGCAELLSEPRDIAYGEIPGMPRSTVAGHAGQLTFGRLCGKPAVVMRGRVHLYEGHRASDVVFGVRLMVLLGARTVVLTNAAGGLDAGFRPGDLMLILDHLNLTGQNCLTGPHEPELGPRFPDMSEVYDPSLRARAERLGAELGIKLVGGVYAGLSGPSYETPAEVRMLQTLGADAVGMSTVLEAIAVRAMGARCLGLSCITNMAAGLPEAVLDHEHVQRTAAGATRAAKQLVQALFAQN